MAHSKPEEPQSASRKLPGKNPFPEKISVDFRARTGTVACSRFLRGKKMPDA